MKTNIKVGIGLSLGAMVVALATIHAIENCNANKHEARVQIAEIENKGKTDKNRKPINENNRKKNIKK